MTATCISVQAGRSAVVCWVSHARLSMAKAANASDPRIVEVRYEALTQDPQAAIDGVATAIGLPSFDCTRADETRHAIGTASLWQARQPVYTASVGRWRAYAEFVPELLGFSDV